MSSASFRRAALASVVPVLFACHHGASVVPGPATGSALDDTARIRTDIEYLASDALEGRGTGTPGNDSAAAYLAREYAQLGLTKIERATTCPEMRTGVRECAVGRASYMQYFSARSVAAAHAGLPGELPTQNVLAMQPGTDPELRGQYVVIGAHYDHLGRSSFDAMDPQAKDAIRHGADDNASGTAAVLELARRFHAAPARRSIIFVNFSGEELGDLGSEHFVDHSPVPLDSIDAMLNFDMVGRLRNDKLIVYGVTTATEMRAIVDSANTVQPPLAITALGDGFGPSDHASF
jgi:aminopeptidase N